MSENHLVQPEDRLEAFLEPWQVPKILESFPLDVSIVEGNREMILHLLPHAEAKWNDYVMSFDGLDVAQDDHHILGRCIPLSAAEIPCAFLHPGGCSQLLVRCSISC